MKNEQEGANENFARDVKFALEMGKFLPEVKYKVDYYKSVMKAESNIIDELSKALDSNSYTDLEKSRFSLEIIEKQNSLMAKTKVFENYLERKKMYESFLDEKSREVAENFESVISEAKENIGYNVRFLQAVAQFESKESHSMQEKVEFYLYVKQELENNKKHYVKKLKKQSKGKVVSIGGEVVNEPESN